MSPSKLLLGLLLSVSCVGQALTLGDGAIVGGLNNPASEARYVLKEEHSSNDGVAGTASLYFGNKWTTTNSYTIRRVSLYIYKNASETADFFVTIRSDSSDSPGTVLATSSTVNRSSINDATTLGWVDFDFNVGASLSASTSYWIVLTKTSTSAYSITWGRGNTIPEHVVSSTDGSAWTDVSTTRGANYKTYALE